MNISLTPHKITCFHQESFSNCCLFVYLGTLLGVNHFNVGAGPFKGRYAYLTLNYYPQYALHLCPCFYGQGICDGCPVSSVVSRVIWIPDIPDISPRRYSVSTWYVYLVLPFYTSNKASNVANSICIVWKE